MYSIDVLRIQTGYYTPLSREEQARFPLVVVLFLDGAQNVDTAASTAPMDAAASRAAFESELRERLQNQFNKAVIDPVACVDGQPPRPTLTHVSLAREDPTRVQIVSQWVDAIARLVWAEGRWIAPAMTAG